MMSLASTPSTNEQDKYLILVHKVQLKPNDKSTNLRKNDIYWYNDVMIAFSALGENPSEEVYDDFIMNKLQETTVFRGHQNLTSAMKLRPEK